MTTQRIHVLQVMLTAFLGGAVFIYWRKVLLVLGVAALMVLSLGFVELIEILRLR